MEKQTNAMQHQVQQQPVAPTEKGKSETIFTPEDVFVILDLGVNEAEQYTQEELLEMGFIKPGVIHDGQLHDS